MVPVYMRMCRNPSPLIGKKETLKIGKALRLKEGSDVTIGACGITVSMALEAAEDLSKKGIKAEILEMGSIKPMDREALVASVKKNRVFSFRRRAFSPGWNGECCS